MTDICTDYLVVGSGAVGLAFADTLLAETDAYITIVDRHGKPGGHWNDAYSFVALHQPSACAVCLTMKPVGEPYAGNPHVRFDERGWETSVAAWPKLPRHPSSTLPKRRIEPVCRGLLMGEADSNAAAR